jgi:hypothetical protein
MQYTGRRSFCENCFRQISANGAHKNSAIRRHDGNRAASDGPRRHADGDAIGLVLRIATDVSAMQFRYVAVREHSAFPVIQNRSNEK